MVNNSTGPIPHFGSDGQIHTTSTGVSDSMWVADTFHTSPGSDFTDLLIQNRLSLIGNPFVQAGFNSIEPSAASTGQNSYGKWLTGTQAQLTSSLSTLITTYSNYTNSANTLGKTIYFHPNMTPITNCAAASDPAHPNADAFWDAVLGTGLTGFSTPLASQMSAAWLATGRTIGFSGQDEGNYQGPMTYPGPVGTIGAPGGPTNIVIDGSGNAVVNWPAATGTLIGSDYPNCFRAIRISGTGTALDNGTSPFSYTVAGADATRIFFGSSPITAQPSHLALSTHSDGTMRMAPERSFPTTYGHVSQPDPRRHPAPDDRPPDGCQSEFRQHRAFSAMVWKSNLLGLL